jgi:hypothetical protein
VAKKHKDEDALDIDRPEVFLKHERRVQQIGVGLLALFVLAGAAGIFGDGPLSPTTATAGAVTLEFDRFVRQTFRTKLQITVDAVTESDGTIEIRIAREFVEGVDLVEIRPSNSLKRLDSDAAVFEVPATGGAAHLEVAYEPKAYGLLDVAVVADGQPPARIRQFVFF